MSPSRSHRGAPDVFGFEGTGDEARAWMDAVYGARLRLTGELGTVQHDRVDHGDLAFDHTRIDAAYSFDADAMPMLVVADILGGECTYVRDGVTDHVRDGDSVLVTGWHMPFAGTCDHPDVRTTSFSRDALHAAVVDTDPEHAGRPVLFTSYVPRSSAAGARWRATVDQVGAMLPLDATPEQVRAATRLLGHTLLHTFASNVVLRPTWPGGEVDDSDGSSATVRRAARIVEDHAAAELSLADLARECAVSPRALQYAFRKHLGCTPQDYLRRVRLDLVRQSLTDGSSPSVGDAATANGFFNPGRFAAYYRDQFHENPGQTLARERAREPS